VWLQKAKLLGYNNYAEVWDAVKSNFFICGFHLGTVYKGLAFVLLASVYFF
jgi:hypothetical protein